MDLISPDCWNHLISSENPADCVSRGMFPAEILEHHLWWSGPTWVKLPQTAWPNRLTPAPDTLPEERCAISCTAVVTNNPLIPLNRFSRFNNYKRVLAWIVWFLDNCRARKRKTKWENGPLNIRELHRAEIYRFSIMQQSHFCKETEQMKMTRRLTTVKRVSTSSIISSLSPILDDDGLLWVGECQQNAKFTYNNHHPIILHSKHPLTKLLIQSEHLHLLYAWWTSVGVCISLPWLPHSRWTQSRSFRHSQLYHLQTQISQAKATDDGTTMAPILWEPIASSMSCSNFYTPED